MVAVVGDPGIGKSRLTCRSDALPPDPRLAVRHAGSVSYGKTTPYRSVIDMLRSYFQIEVRDEARRVRERVIPDGTRWSQRSDAGGPWRQSRPAPAREPGPTASLLVIEDLHWIDAETQALLDSLVEAVAGTRLMLLVNYRPEFQHQWGAGTYADRLRTFRGGTAGGGLGGCPGGRGLVRAPISTQRRAEVLADVPAELAGKTFETSRGSPPGRLRLDRREQDRDRDARRTVRATGESVPVLTRRGSGGWNPATENETDKWSGPAPENWAILVGESAGYAARREDPHDKRKCEGDQISGLS